LAVDGNGGGVRGVTRTGDALWPVWAPDGRSIVYARVGDLTPDGAPDYTSSLWAIDPEGGTPRRLTDPAEGISERPWSFAPDGSRLAITRARLPALERRAEKTRLVLLVVRRHDARLHPRTAIQNAEVYSIWHVNPDGTCPEALLAGRPHGNWYASPVWSPGRPTRRPKRLRC
jgi:hypothetical protein